MVIKGRDHVIDLARNTVIKNNYQKFKFEALRPFDSVTKVEFTNVSYSLLSKLDRGSWSDYWDWEKEMQCGSEMTIEDNPWA